MHGSGVYFMAIAFDTDLEDLPTSKPIGLSQLTNRLPVLARTGIAYDVAIRTRWLGHGEHAQESSGGEDILCSRHQAKAPFLAWLQTRLTPIFAAHATSKC